MNNNATQSHSGEHLLAERLYAIQEYVQIKKLINAQTFHFSRSAPRRQHWLSYTANVIHPELMSGLTNE